MPCSACTLLKGKKDGIKNKIAKNLIPNNRHSLSKSRIFYIITYIFKDDDRITINFIKLKKFGESKEMLLEMTPGKVI